MCIDSLALKAIQSELSGIVDGVIKLFNTALLTRLSSIYRSLANFFILLSFALINLYSFLVKYPFLNIYK